MNTLITGKMRGSISALLSSFRESLKNRGRRCENITHDSRPMIASRPEKCSDTLLNFSADKSGSSVQHNCDDITEGISLEEQNDAAVVNNTNIDKILRMNLNVNDTDLVPHAANYRLPQHTKTVPANDDPDSLREQIKISKQNDYMDNERMHSMQTAINNLEYKMASMQSAIKDLSTGRKRVKSIRK